MLVVGEGGHRLDQGRGPEGGQGHRLRDREGLGRALRQQPVEGVAADHAPAVLVEGAVLEEPQGLGGIHVGELLEVAEEGVVLARFQGVLDGFEEQVPCHGDRGHGGLRLDVDHGGLRVVRDAPVDTTTVAVAGPVQAPVLEFGEHEPRTAHDPLEPERAILGRRRAEGGVRVRAHEHLGPGQGLARRIEQDPLECVQPFHRELDPVREVRTLLPFGPGEEQPGSPDHELVPLVRVELGRRRELALRAEGEGLGTAEGESAFAPTHVLGGGAPHLDDGSRRHSALDVNPRRRRDTTCELDHELARPHREGFPRPLVPVVRGDLEGSFLRPFQLEVAPVVGHRQGVGGRPVALDGDVGRPGDQGPRDRCSGRVDDGAAHGLAPGEGEGGQVVPVRVRDLDAPQLGGEVAAEVGGLGEDVGDLDGTGLGSEPVLAVRVRLDPPADGGAEHAEASPHALPVRTEDLARHGHGPAVPDQVPGEGPVGPAHGLGGDPEDGRRSGLDHGHRRVLGRPRSTVDDLPGSGELEVPGRVRHQAAPVVRVPEVDVDPSAGLGDGGGDVAGDLDVDGHGLLELDPVFEPPALSVVPPDLEGLALPGHPQGAGLGGEVARDRGDAVPVRGDGEGFAQLTGKPGEELPRPRHRLEGDPRGGGGLAARPDHLEGPGLDRGEGDLEGAARRDLLGPQLGPRQASLGPDREHAEGLGAAVAEPGRGDRRQEGARTVGGHFREDDGGVEHPVRPAGQEDPRGVDGRSVRVGHAARDGQVLEEDEGDGQGGEQHGVHPTRGGGIGPDTDPGLRPLADRSREGRPAKIPAT